MRCAEPSSDSVCLIWSVKTGANLRGLVRTMTMIMITGNNAICKLQNRPAMLHELDMFQQHLNKSWGRQQVNMTSELKAMPSQQDWSLPHYMHST